MSTMQSDNKLSRRERERLMRRQAMLRAARSVFAEKGYARATLDEIAERAEFGKGTLYNYFEGGKEEILFAVFDEIYDDLYRLIQKTFTDASEQPIRERFRALVLEAFTFFLEREDLFMVIIKESHRLCFSEDTEQAAYFQQQQARMVNALVPVLQTAMERGAIRKLPPEAIAHMLLENINGMLVHRVMMDRHEECTTDSILHSPEKAADFLTTILFDGLALSSTVTDVASSDLRTNE